MKNYNHPADIILFLSVPLLYLGVLLLFSWRSRIKGKSTDTDYFLGGRTTGSFSALVSVVATETSVASIIVFPAAGYSSGFSVLWLAAGYIVGRIIAAEFYLRKLYESNEISIYAAMTGGPVARDVLSGFYLLAKFLSSGGRFFLGGFALAQMFPGDTYLWLVLVTVVVGLYSLSGGIRAVIVTDQLQGWIIAGMGLLFIALIGSELSGKLATLTGEPFGQNPLLAFPLDLDFASSNSRNSLALFLGGIVLTIGTHAADQDMLQRVLSTRSFAEARRSLLFSGPGAFVVILMYSLVGVLLSGIARAGVTEAGVFDERSPLVSYVTAGDAPLLSGLFAVLLIAAAMSTMDSAIHSTGAVWKGLFRSRKTGRLWSALSLIVLLGAGLSFVELARAYDNFLDLVMGSMNYINGGLIGIITVFTFQPRILTSTGIVAGLLTGLFTTVVLTWIMVPALAWPWTTIASAVLATLVVGLTGVFPSLTGGLPARDSTKQFTRKDEQSPE